MDKFFLVSLLVLLIVANGVSGSMMCDNNFGMLEELNNLDTEEDYEVEELSDIPSWTSERGGKVLVNIDSFGAAGNGETDDTEVKFFHYLQISPIFSMFNMHFTHSRLLNICNCYIFFCIDQFLFIGSSKSMGSCLFYTKICSIGSKRTPLSC